MAILNIMLCFHCSCCQICTRLCWCDVLDGNCVSMLKLRYESEEATAICIDRYLRFPVFLTYVAIIYMCKKYARPSRVIRQLCLTP